MGCEDYIINSQALSYVHSQNVPVLEVIVEDQSLLQVMIRTLGSMIGE